MIDTKEPALTPEAFVARWRKIIALLRFNSGLLIPDIEKDVKGMLEAIRKPVEGIERPDVEEYLLAADVMHIGLSEQAGRRFSTYILALETEIAHLRAALRSANDPTHGHPDETDDRAMEDYHVPKTER